MNYRVALLLMRAARRVFGLAAWFLCVDKKGRAVVTTAALLKTFLCVGKRNVALNGVAAELRGYMRGGVSRYNVSAIH